MTKTTQKSNCNSCKKANTPSKRNLGLWGGLILAILPKCPFCVMAYTGTLALCSKETVQVLDHSFSSATTIAVTSFFCLFTLAGIYLNNRGNRTRFALMISAAGTIIVLCSAAFYGGIALYYAGVAIIFAGAWLNGSLLYFINKAKQIFSSPVFYRPSKRSY
jgi:hypothetical protein